MGETSTNIQRVSSGLTKWKNVVPKWLKQTGIMLTIMGLTGFTEASITLLEEHDPFDGLICVPGVLLMLLVTEFLGRKRLFMALFALSIMSSIMFLAGLPFISLIILAPVHGSTVAVTSIVMYEYCDPKNRIVFLITNAFIQKLTYWATLTCHEQFNDFSTYLQSFGILSGLVCLGSVFTWPESPYWLASKCKYDECKQAFMSIRSEKSQLSGELEAMMKGPRCGSFKMVVIPILMAFLILVLKSFLYFAEEALFKEIKKQTLNLFDDLWFYLILNCVAFVSIILCISVAFNITRRELFLLSSISVNIVSLSLLEALLSPTEGDVKSGLLFVLVLNLIVIFVSSALTFPIFIEAIPQKYVTLLLTVISPMYYIVLTLLGNYFTFTDVAEFRFSSIISAFVFVFSVVIYYLMPETKDKSLLEIEQSYLPKRKQLLSP